MKRWGLVVAMAMALAVAGCSSDGASPTSGVAAETTRGVADVTTAAPTGDTAPGAGYEVVGDDYAFSGVPDRVEPGATFTFTNESDVEVHEMVVARIADGEVLGVDELIALPVEEMQTLMWFQGTLVALPDSAGVVPGDTATTSLVVEEPGQYLLLCLIPEGSDVEAAEEALAAGDTDEPIDLGDGELHARLGMYARFDVVAPD